MYAQQKFNIEMYISVNVLNPWVVKCYIESEYIIFSMIRNYIYNCLSCVNSLAKKHLSSKADKLNLYITGDMYMETKE